MKQVLKVQVPPGPGIYQLFLPNYYDMLTAQFQDGAISLWALCDVGNDTVSCRVLVAGTGQPLPDEVDMDDFTFTGTIQLANGLVWHVFHD